MVVSARMGENFHSVVGVSQEASNFINFHFENGLLRVKGRGVA
jgi:hypothetical protein